MNTANPSTKIGLLASGNLGFDAILHIAQKSTPSFVFTDKASAPIQNYCEQNHISFFVGNPRSQRAIDFSASIDCDVLLSVNYRFLIEEWLIQLPRLAAINIHGSLLPKYRGRTPHVWAIINNEKETGVTAHLIEPECDSGAILLQKRIAISDTNTGGEILKKFQCIYPRLITELLTNTKNLLNRRKPQEQHLATTFPARTPEDGRICWDWQRERIQNWIRALAPPYPGAFFELAGQRIVVLKSSLTEAGFDSLTTNGKVLAVDPFIVKTPNGAIELECATKPAINPSLNTSFPVLT